MPLFPVSSIKACIKLKQAGKLITKDEIISIILASCLAGMFYGFIFGLMDIEDIEDKSLLRHLIKEENYCIPIGAFFGLISGVVAVLFSNSVTLYK